MFQKTIKKNVSISGIGLHSGQSTKVTIKPGKVNSGIVFVRSDLSTNNTVKAFYSYVKSTNLCTLISNTQGVSVSTIEHLMSAFSGLEINNAVVEVNALELPILDGSALEWVKLINKAGIVNQNEPARYIKVLKRIDVTTEHYHVTLEPSNDFNFDVSIVYPSDTVIGSQGYNFSNNSPAEYIKEVSKARTFCMKEDITLMQSQGLVVGGSLSNALVADGMRVLNPEGLRYENEFARHKLLDSVGDLYLSGYKILGNFIGYKSGHESNNVMLHALFKNPSNYKILNFNKVMDLHGEDEDLFFNNDKPLLQ